MAEVLILLEDETWLPLVEDGLQMLRDCKVSFSLRISSAWATGDHWDALIDSHNGEGGRAILCIGEYAIQTASLVTSRSLLPILAVRVEGDVILQGQPMAYPIAQWRPGKAGVVDAAMFLVQMIGAFDEERRQLLQQFRSRCMARVMESHHNCRVEFNA